MNLHQLRTAWLRFYAMTPASEIADEGWFWLGEARYRDRAFQDSLSTFKTLLEYFPAVLVSMARLRIGMNHYELKEFVEARSVLSSLLQETDNEEIKIRAEGLVKNERCGCLNVHFRLRGQADLIVS